MAARLRYHSEPRERPFRVAAVAGQRVRSIRSAGRRTDSGAAASYRRMVEEEA